MEENKRRESNGKQTYKGVGGERRNGIQHGEVRPFQAQCVMIVTSLSSACLHTSTMRSVAYSGARAV